MFSVCKKINRKHYIIWKVKEFGFKKEELLTLWKVVLGPIAEYAAPLWHSGLIESDTRNRRLIRGSSPQGDQR